MRVRSVCWVKRGEQGEREVIFTLTMQSSFSFHIQRVRGNAALLQLHSLPTAHAHMAIIAFKQKG